MYTCVYIYDCIYIYIYMIVYIYDYIYIYVIVYIYIYRIYIYNVYIICIHCACKFMLHTHSLSLQNSDPSSRDMLSVETSNGRWHVS